ncbi:MAG: hypothetical protein AAFV93_09425 [Chloroflexota bacterium]
MSGTTLATLQETDTNINSNTMLRIVQVVFVALLVFGAVYNIRVAVLSFHFFTEQATTFITNDTLANAYPWGMIISRGFITTILLAVGLIIFIKQHTNRMAIITSFFLVSYGFAGISFIYRTPDATNYIINNNLYLNYIILSEFAYISLFAVIHTFPNANIKPYWGIISLIFTIVVAVLWAIPDTSIIHPTNWNIILFAFVYLIMITTLLLFQRYRYKYIFTPTQRQQSKIIFFGFSISLTLGALLTTLAQNYPHGAITHHTLLILVDFASLPIPITLSIAILRYRLWDIDAVIRRTLIYAVVSTLLSLAYFAIILITQNLLSDFIPQDNALVIVASTLAVTALFNPLLQRVQTVIDRLFYRKRYDAEATLEQFSAKIRDAVDAETIEQEILKTITSTIQPETISLWVLERNNDDL